VKKGGRQSIYININLRTAKGEIQFIPMKIFKIINFKINFFYVLFCTAKVKFDSFKSTSLLSLYFK